MVPTQPRNLVCKRTNISKSSSREPNPSEKSFDGKIWIGTSTFVPRFLPFIGGKKTPQFHNHQSRNKCKNRALPNQMYWANLSLRRLQASPPGPYTYRPSRTSAWRSSGIQRHPAQTHTSQLWNFLNFPAIGTWSSQTRDGEVRKKLNQPHNFKKKKITSPKASPF